MSTISAPSPRMASTKFAPAWLIPALLLLGALPVSFGMLRLLTMSGVAPLMPADGPYLAAPVPLVTHIVSAAVYALLGALQFSPSIRRRWPTWHRYAGRVLVLCGALVATSALWLSVAHLQATTAGLLLVALRVVLGTSMLACLGLGFRAILRRDVPRHQAWMTRAYAIGLGAATQMLVLMVAEIVAGPPDEIGRTLLIGLAWAINIAIAECSIRAQKLTLVL